MVDQMSLIGTFSIMPDMVARSCNMYGIDNLILWPKYRSIISFVHLLYDPTLDVRSGTFIDACRQTGGIPNNLHLSKCLLPRGNSIRGEFNGVNRFLLND